MTIMQLSLFSVLADKMRWHQARQGVLAENVANAETPGFRANELKPFDVAENESRASFVPMATAATRPGHISIVGTASSGFSSRTEDGFEITPEGNGVTLEEQMTRVTQNQLDYQTVTALYTRSIGILKIALGKSA